MPEPERRGIVVLYNDSDRLIKGEPQDLLADRGVVACAHAIADALQGGGRQVALLPMYDDVESTLAPYPPDRWLVFNLGEGLAGRLFEESRIAWALEAMGYCFTGAGGNAIALSTHKGSAKAALAANGVPTPAWWLFRHPDELDAPAVIDEQAFPLIVKPVAEDASIGVGPEAVVHSPDALRRRVAYIVQSYRQMALAEAFVDGREFNVAVWGEPARVLPLAEIDLSAFSDPYDRIVSFSAKWEEGTFDYHHTPAICPAQVDGDVGERIAETALRAWSVLGCWGYGRVDMRLSGEGIPYVVEVNCNPDLSPDAGFYRAARASGYSYESMLLAIIDAARERFAIHDRASSER